ncbi:cytochrome c oxidase assembly protein [Parvularcula lutaonensis]|uniref:Cytochrome c oxidase assembly protein CtaG n=1 Tax=Parvularcula lutaonensis TaxID=491923 RepID=A0ABV7MFB6_9PROT|nr:cytochrome c oxidase assembly protein [Parvularcula lutaonensis]GGY53075.1 cytochrome c oxidase assembly protein CtaG [Parvularcula lutaonensis]
MDRNARVALLVSGLVAGMVGLSFAAVPLYRAFCQVTGWGGTTQVAEAEADRVLKRKVTVRFDASRAEGIPWEFKPAQVSQTLRIGETGLAYYEATNLSDEPVIGSATFNVQPAKAGGYFMKVDCFCFEEQLLQPGETVMMPVTYYIDPEMDDERRLDDVREITLSYTFYRNEDAEKREGLNAERYASK